MYAVITGATKGIGRAILDTVAPLCNKIITCSRNEHDLNMLMSEFEGKYKAGFLIAYQADLSQKVDRASFVKSVLEIGVPDILVNNVGIFTQDKLSDIFPGENLEQMLQANFYSTMEITQSLLPHLVVKGDAHIINICSIAGASLYMDSASYTLAKTMQLTYSRMLREYLKDKGIKVTSVIPGATFTSSWEGIDIDKQSLIAPKDVAEIIKTCLTTTIGANVEEIIIKPTKG